MNGPAGTIGTCHGPTVRSGAMKGRKVSDETADIVRELRRRGLSLRQIARRAKISKSTVYRLTKGISWEQASPVQPRVIEMEKTATDDRTEWTAPRAVGLPVPRAKMEAADEDRWSWVDEAQSYFRQMCAIVPLRSHDAVQEQHLRVTVSDREESQLDEAEAYLRRTPILCKVYKCLELDNRLDAMQSEDPLRTYSELRRKALAPIVMILRIMKMHHLQTR